MGNGGYISMGRLDSCWKPLPDSASHPRRGNEDGRQGHKVFYEQLQRVIYVPFEGRVKGYNLKVSQLLVAQLHQLKLCAPQELLQPGALERVLLWSIKCLVFLESQKWDRGVITKWNESSVRCKKIVLNPLKR